MPRNSSTNRQNSSSRNARVLLSPRYVYLFAGQSNMSAYSPTITLYNTDFSGVGYAPGYAQTTDNEWTGAPPASTDTGFQYRYPKLSLHPCLYAENTRGTEDGAQDAWGSFVKEYYNYQGVLGVGGSYGLELSFLHNHLSTYPSIPIAAIKQSLGGTSLRGDWLPNTVALGTARAGTANTITLATSDFGTSLAYTGLVMKIVQGTGSSQIVTITAYDSTTKIATVSPAWSVVPDSTSQYGIERLQTKILRTMIQSAIGRLNGSSQAWKWGGFVWMQGESGAHANIVSDSTYLSDARAFFAYIRSLTRSDLPIVVGRIGDNWTKDNAYLISQGIRYQAIDYSITSSSQTVTQGLRDTYDAGAYTRRATQATLGSDANCVMFSNDGYQVRSLTLDNTAYHWHPTGNLAAGERAFAAYQTIRN